MPIFPNTKVLLPDTHVVVPHIASTLVIHWFHYAIFNPGSSNANNFHKMFELVHCLDGSATLWLNEEPIEIRSGDFVLIKSGVKHRIYTHPGSDYAFVSIIFDIDDPKLRSELHALIHAHLSAEQAVRSPMTSAVEQAKRVLQSHLGGSSLAPNEKMTILDLSSREKLSLQASLLQLLSEFIALQPKDAAPGSRQASNELSPFEIEKAHRIAALLDDNLYSNITISDLSRTFLLSRSQCTRIFTRVYGVPPRHYLSMVKLKAAKELLIQSELTVKEISDKLGFSSANHFGRQFRRWTGYSPNHFKPKQAKQTK